MDWKKELEYSIDGCLKSNLTNAYLIVKNDPCLKGRIYEKLNESTHKRHYGKNDYKYRNIPAIYCRAPLPWKDQTGEYHYTDIDDTYLRMYLEKAYSVTFSKSIIVDVVSLVAAENGI